MRTDNMFFSEDIFEEQDDLKNEQTVFSSKQKNVKRYNSETIKDMKRLRKENAYGCYL